MNNKGFTMIELLAIITILATILLVSFPTLINMTRKDKERQYNDMVTTLCKAGETYIYDNQESFPELNTSGEEFYVRVANLIKNDLINKSQNNPKTGNSIYQNLLEFKVNNDKSLSCSYLERSLANLLQDNGTSGLSIGDKYEYEVAPGKKYNFYVLSFEDDKVNLIMDRNICEDGTVIYTEANNYCKYAWYDDGDDPVDTSNDTNEFGPVTAMTILGNATRNWTNVPNLNLTYDDIENNNNIGTYGYTGMTITNGIGYITKKDGITQTPITLTDNKPIKARLPKYSEVTGTDAKCTGTNGSCEPWLVDNLRYYSASNDKYSLNSANTEETDIYKIQGYWLLSSDPSTSVDARRMYFRGNVGNGVPPSGSGKGIRAVITVLKSDFS